jgi:hypothetical protein
MVNGEQERMWMEYVIVYFKILSERKPQEMSGLRTWNPAWDIQKRQQECQLLKHNCKLMKIGKSQFILFICVIIKS